MEIEILYRYKDDTKRFHKYEAEEPKTADYIAPPFYLSRKVKSAPRMIKIVVSDVAPGTVLRKFVAGG